MGGFFFLDAVEGVLRRWGLLETLYVLRKGEGSGGG